MNEDGSVNPPAIDATGIINRYFHLRDSLANVVNPMTTDDVAWHILNRSGYELGHAEIIEALESLGAKSVPLTSMVFWCLDPK